MVKDKVYFHAQIASKLKLQKQNLGRINSAKNRPIIISTRWHMHGIYTNTLYISAWYNGLSGISAVVSGGYIMLYFKTYLQQ